MNAIRSALIWAAIILLIVLWLPLLALIRLLDWDPARYTTGRLFRDLGSAMTRVNPFWQIRIEGPMPADPRHPFVVVSNHQSLGDIPVISRLPWEMKWVAKAELFKLPVAGWMMKMAGDIPVNRGDTSSRATAVKRARRMLAHRCSVMFFPEGTRSKDARVRRFQTGAFRLAIDAGVPVLPIAIDGTSNAIPKHGWQFGERIEARVRVLDPIRPADVGTNDPVVLAEEVRMRIIAQIAEWRGVSRAEVDALAKEEPRPDG